MWRTALLVLTCAGGTLGGSRRAHTAQLQPYISALSGIDAPADDFLTRHCDTGDATSGCCCKTNTRANNSNTACTNIEQVLCYVKGSNQKIKGDVADSNKVQEHGKKLWIITCGALVFFMQCGFAMLEAGSVRFKNTQNILFKNLYEACIGAIGFYAIGYALAYGDNGDGQTKFIGTTNFFLMRESSDESGQHSFFFQFAFAATGATIISGSVAERTKLVAYLCYSVGIVCWIYPVVAHWVWSTKGWLSAWAQRSDRFDEGNGMIDFAGSGVVHAVGGWAGLVAAIALGPRIGRFEGGEVREMAGQSPMFQCLGVLILWFGWYGFNCGSTLAFDGDNAGKVATTTTLGAAFGGCATILFTRVHTGSFDVSHGMNGILAGLVSITAGCAVVDEWCAVLIGIIGGCVYYGAANLLLCLQIDDPLNAWPVHGVGGVWGCLAVGIFAQVRNIDRVYGTDEEMVMDSRYVSNGRQFAVQLLGIFCIVVWTVGLSCILFFGLKMTIGLRVDEAEERKGLDVVEHGSTDYSVSFQQWSGMVNKNGNKSEPYAVDPEDGTAEKEGADEQAENAEQQ